MTTKTELINLFLRNIISDFENIGYSKISRNAAAKLTSSKHLVVVRFEFFGSSCIEVVCYYGARVEWVEKALQSMATFPEKNPNITKHEQTIFQRIDKAYELIFNDKFPSFFIIEDDVILNFSRYVEIIYSIESYFSSILSLADYILLDKNLPIGHHAFRAPFILIAAGRKSECRIYMDNVLSTGFIPGYHNFVEEFWTLPLALDR